MPSKNAIENGLTLSNESVRELAKNFGTPLYVIDESTYFKNIRTYKSAFEKASPGSKLIYATKANSTLALLQIALNEGLILDVASEGELRAAIQAGAKPQQIIFHGSNKLVSELALALNLGVAQIIVDNFEEIDHLIRLETSNNTQFLLRLAPAVDPITHKKIATGQADTKFGFSIADGSALIALQKCLQHNLPIIGFHCHVGSQLFDPKAQVEGGEILADFAIMALEEVGFETKYLNLGGGRAVDYTCDNNLTSLEDYCNSLVQAVRNRLSTTSLHPTLAQEPGRSLVANAGVTIYQVGVVKSLNLNSGKKTYISVDGGLSDNLRPGLYNADYSIKVVAGHDHLTRSNEEIIATVVGRHCESDVLFIDKLVPHWVTEGDYIQVISTGAYNSSMASNYNRFPRPAMILIRTSGEHVVIQKRESWDQILANEVLINLP